MNFTFLSYLTYCIQRFIVTMQRQLTRLNEVNHKIYKSTKDNCIFSTCMTEIHNVFHVIRIYVSWNSLQEGRNLLLIKKLGLHSLGRPQRKETRQIKVGSMCECFLHKQRIKE